MCNKKASFDKVNQMRLIMFLFFEKSTWHKKLSVSHG